MDGTNKGRGKNFMESMRLVITEDLKEKIPIRFRRNERKVNSYDEKKLW